ncbi:MAG: YaaC family protein [Gammaproteobacteria bacterium]
MNYRDVASFHDSAANETMLRFEQRTPLVYGHRPSDKIPALVEKLRHHLWAVANNTRPFREYYLYVAPVLERQQVVPQLISIYAITFYLGSIARYRPQHFDSILASTFGSQLQEFLSSQPTQFVYLLASDFAKREIARAALA